MKSLGTMFLAFKIWQVFSLVSKLDPKWYTVGMGQGDCWAEWEDVG